MSVSAFPYGSVAASNPPGGGGETVSLNTSNVTRNSTVTTVYAVLQYNSSGEEFENSGVGNNTNTSRGLWLDSGSSSNVWFERIINSGSLFSDPGSGRLVMSSSRTLRCVDSNPASGGQSCNLDIKMWDAASGGSTLDSVAGLLMSATYFDPCPLCCFTPDTLITMADGTKKPIVYVEAGEMIQIQGSLPEPVGQVIEREKRPMVKLTFADGRELVLSVDHPIYVKGKGMAAINTDSLYKGKLAQELKVGDYAMTEAGILVQVKSIEHYDYPGKVYTFSNSRFFAGGILVY